MKWRKLILYPFGLLYGCLAWLRRSWFNNGPNRRQTSSVYTVAIGNLTVGGTGKTPIAIWLSQMLATFGQTAILSRGYGRKTKGFLKVDTSQNSETVGDEPLEIHTALQASSIQNFVCEKRVEGIQTIVSNNPDLQYIVLDDAFQHLPIKAGFYLLLCDYNRPFYQDQPMPSGNLREFACTAKNADAIVFTKCPPNLSMEEALALQKKVNKYGKPVYFSTFHNSEPRNEGGIIANKKDKLFVFSGLANDNNFTRWAKNKITVMGSQSFADHHEYSAAELQQLHETAKQLHAQGLLTTRKDWMRIKDTWPVTFLPVFVTYTEPIFLFGGEEELFHLILKRTE